MTYAEMFQKIASAYGLRWELLAEQAYRESRMDPSAVGAANDMGLMQIVPATWQEWASKVGVRDPFDPYDNLKVAAAYLAFLRDHFAELGYREYYWTLVAYNWGPGNLERHLRQGLQWNDIPEACRKYALDIIFGAEARTLGQMGVAGHGRDEARSGSPATQADDFRRLLVRQVYPD